jgi:hypothetical protein
LKGLLRKEMAKYLEKKIQFSNKIIVNFIGVMERNRKLSGQKDLPEKLLVVCFGESLLYTPSQVNVLRKAQLRKILFVLLQN